MTNFFIIILIKLIFLFFTILGNNNNTTESIYKWHPKHQNNSITHQEKPKNSTRILLKMATPCITPNNDSGYCVEIYQCPILMRKIDNSDDYDFLIQSKCGPPNENPLLPKVCCGKYNTFKHKNKIKNAFPKKCGYQNIRLKGRIFGGNEAQLGEFPWLVRLIHRNKNGYKTYGCTGFLIHPKYVLTAAHCLDSENTLKLGPIFEVQLGEHNTETQIDCDNSTNVCADDPQQIRVAENIVHPNYNNNSLQHHYDIGLIYLKKGARLSNYVQPICLLEENNIKFTEYWISGWGKTESHVSSPIKLKVSLPKYNFDKCSDLYSLIDIKLLNSQLCAGGEKNKDSCAGDSGGPLMILDEDNNKRWVAAGIVSYGFGCGKQEWPGVYTNVTTYLEWIKKSILTRTNATTKKIH